MVVYADGAVIETRQEPWLRGMEIDGFDAVGSIKNFTLGVVCLKRRNEIKDLLTLTSKSMAVGT